MSGQSAESRMFGLRCQYVTSFNHHMTHVFTSPHASTGQLYGSSRHRCCLQVLANIAQRLEAMHAAGYAHRDLKPANVMWLPRENQWTLIDFGCAAKVGKETPLSFTMAYAAPEVIGAWQSGQKSILAAEEQDSWSLGVMVFELLTGRPAFDMFKQGREEVRTSRFHSLPSAGT
jgi:serine/threonine protein kinase